jgi:hypothetical protein
MRRRLATKTFVRRRGKFLFLTDVFPCPGGAEASRGSSSGLFLVLQPIIHEDGGAAHSCASSATSILPIAKRAKTGYNCSWLIV